MSLITYQDLVDNEVPNAQNNTHWTAMIASAEDWVTRHCNRKIAYYEYIEKLISDYSGIIYLKEIPIESIDLVKIDDTELTKDEYEIDLTTGRMEIPNYNTEVEVTYNGGYSEIPQAVKTAVCMVANIIHLQFQQGIAGSQSVGGISINFQLTENVFKCAENLLKPYVCRFV
jgi:hypothetical protein